MDFIKEKKVDPWGQPLFIRMSNFLLIFDKLPSREHHLVVQYL